MKTIEQAIRNIEEMRRAGIPVGVAIEKAGISPMTYYKKRRQLRNTYDKPAPAENACEVTNGYPIAPPPRFAVHYCPNCGVHLDKIDVY